MSTNILLLQQLSMTASIVNNADWRDALPPFTDASGNVIDITGIAFRGQIRSSVGDAKVWLEVSTSDGTLLNGGATGILTLAVSVAKTQTITPGAYVFDLLAIDGGVVVTVNLFQAAPAQITILQGVTR